jgi:hypothetical protein
VLELYFNSSFVKSTAFSKALICNVLIFVFEDAVAISVTASVISCPATMMF